jgi:manganese/zinc/iron transport system permease protein
VLTAGAIVLFSLLLAPNRGLLWNWVRRQRNRRTLRLEAVLGDLYRLANQHNDREHAHSLAVLQAMNAGRGGVQRSLKALADKGWVREAGDEQWALTPDGAIVAERLLNRGV